MSIDSPFVSVAIISYRHAPFIARALESVLEQATSFPIEIITSDDGSPDGTAAIIDTIAAAHPGRIRRMDPETNIGMHENFRRVWQACRGEYIALLEGDDYWTDPGKLTKQVAFLRSHPEVVLCGHPVSTLLPTSVFGPDMPSTITPPSLGDATDLLKLGNYVPTCSIMARRGVVEQIPDWIRQTKFVDYSLLLLHGLRGRIGMLSERMGCYRIHDGGAWSSTSTLRQVESELIAMRLFAQHHRDESPAVHDAVRDRVGYLLDYLRDEAYEARRRGEYRLSLRLHRELLRHRLHTRDTIFAIKSLLAAILSLVNRRR
jgi:glycosyltransferase involved in cell wall biosynthesis